MKPKYLFLLCSLFFCLKAQAGRVILSCNPPMGSSIQEFRVTQYSPQQMTVQELTDSGHLGPILPVQIKSSTCLSWKSFQDGSVIVCKEMQNGRVGWFYRGGVRNFQVRGYLDCR